MAQTVFTRSEKKYLVSERQYKALMAQISGALLPDAYRNYTIETIYYDTDDYRLIRNSIDKPIYKEKLRLRSYGPADDDAPVFLELKKKFDGVVYKRRAKMAHREALAFIRRPDPCAESQILREIAFFLNRNDVAEKAFVGCRREAYRGIGDGSLRITFDRDLCFRDTDLSLSSGSYGTSLLKPGRMLMEVKGGAAMPIWLARALAKEGIFPQSFSKYGTAYKSHLLDASLEAAHNTHTPADLPDARQIVTTAFSEVVRSA